RVWVTSGFDIVKLDETSGRVLGRYRTRYPFPIELGASDGNVWVSSVENGFVSGALTRIPLGAGRTTHPLVFPSRPLLSLPVGSGTTWALVGPWASLRLAAVDQASRRITLARLRKAVGWIAADDTGATPGLYGVTLRGAVVRLDPVGRPIWTASTGILENPPAAAPRDVSAPRRGRVQRLGAAVGRLQAGRAHPVRPAAAVHPGVRR